MRLARADYTGNGEVVKAYPKVLIPEMNLGQLSLLERVWTAGAGVLSYLRASVWPAELSFFYPHPLLLGQSVLAAGSAGVVVALSVSALAWRSRACCPAFFAGWFWFLGMLVPVLGLVQVGDQAWADRYAARVRVLAAAERSIAPGSSTFALAVAEGLFKLMSTKDEYEVARLYTDGTFGAEVDRRFEGRYKVRYHLAPPLLARRDGAAATAAIVAVLSDENKAELEKQTVEKRQANKERNAARRAERGSLPVRV